MRARVAVVACGMFGLISGRSVSAQNIVSNPGFENGSAGWTLGELWFTSGAYVGNAHTGTGQAATGCGDVGCLTPDPSPFGGWIYQDLTTIVGKSYNLSFWINPSGGTDQTDQVRVLFGSTIADDYPALPGTGIYTQFFNTAPLIATSTTTRLEFLARSSTSTVRLDDISVTAINGLPSTTVPEPASIALFASGLLVVLLANRRRARE